MTTATSFKPLAFRAPYAKTRVVLGMWTLLLLSACATTQHVPVPAPEPPQVARPVLETQFLKPGDSPDKVIQAHRLAIKQLQQWGLELEALLDGYRKGSR